MSSGPSNSVPCPNCAHGKAWTIDTRLKQQGITRRRECGECGHRFTTVEILEPKYAAVMGVVRAARHVSEMMSA